MHRVELTAYGRWEYLRVPNSCQHLRRREHVDTGTLARSPSHSPISFLSAISTRCPLVFEMLHLGLDGKRRSTKHGGRKHSGTDAGQSTRTRTSATEGPLAMAEICDAHSGFAAGSCSDCHSHERLECLGRWKG